MRSRLDEPLEGTLLSEETSTDLRKLPRILSKASPASMVIGLFLHVCQALEAAGDWSAFGMKVLGCSVDPV